MIVILMVDLRCHISVAYIPINSVFKSNNKILLHLSIGHDGLFNSLTLCHHITTACLKKQQETPWVVTVKMYVHHIWDKVHKWEGT